MATIQALQLAPKYSNTDPGSIPSQISNGNKANAIDILPGSSLKVLEFVEMTNMLSEVCMLEKTAMKFQSLIFWSGCNVSPHTQALPVKFPEVLGVFIG